MPHCYVGLATLKSRLDIADTDDDTLLRVTAEGVADWIDQLCDRTFQPYTATRYFTSRFSGRLQLDADLLTITTLKTDVNGQYTWGTTWASTDYDLEPWEAVTEKRPYTQIRVHPTGTQSFPTTRKGVEVAGVWGYWLDTLTSSATLNEALDTSETGVDVTDGTQFEVGQTVLIGSEQCYISSKATTTLTVERAVNGTTAATHSSGAAIAVYRYPDRVVEAAIFQCVRTWRRTDTPFGVAGSAEMGHFTTIPKVDQDVRLNLVGLRRISAGTV